MSCHVSCALLLLYDGNGIVGGCFNVGGIVCAVFVVFRMHEISVGRLASYSTCSFLFQSWAPCTVGEISWHRWQCIVMQSIKLFCASYRGSRKVPVSQPGTHIPTLGGPRTTYCCAWSSSWYKYHVGDGVNCVVLRKILRV